MRPPSAMIFLFFAPQIPAYSRAEPHGYILSTLTTLYWAGCVELVGNFYKVNFRKSQFFVAKKSSVKICFDKSFTGNA